MKTIVVMFNLLFVVLLLVLLAVYLSMTDSGAALLKVGETSSAGVQSTMNLVYCAVGLFIGAVLLNLCYLKYVTQRVI